LAFLSLKICGFLQDLSKKLSDFATFFLTDIRMVW
jgi:hypothetical protein